MNYFPGVEKFNGSEQLLHNVSVEVLRANLNIYNICNAKTNAACE